jgi:hypothetical protein
MTPPLSCGSFGPVVHAFFLERLVAQRNTSPRTVAAYRDSFRLLLQFAKHHLKKAPEALDLQDLDAPLWGGAWSPACAPHRAGAPDRPPTERRCRVS